MGYVEVIAHWSWPFTFFLGYISKLQQILGKTEVPCHKSPQAHPYKVGPYQLEVELQLHLSGL